MDKQLSIAQRLSLGFGLLLSLMLFISVIGAQRVAFIEETLTQSVGAPAKQRYAINFRGSVHDRAIAIRDAVLVDSERELDLHLGEVERLKRFYLDSARAMDELFARGGSSADEVRLLDAIKEIERDTLPLTEQLLRLRQDGRGEEARALLLSRASPAYAEWLKRINAFIDYQEAVLKADLSRVSASASGFLTLILVVASVATLLSLVIGYIIIARLKSVLGAEPYQVAKAINRLAEGDLTVAVQTRHPDSVMGAIGTLVDHLGDTIRQVRAAAADLASASTELQTTSDRNNAQIGVQSREAEQMATAIKQMSATVNEVASYAAKAAAATRQADGEVATGAQVVGETAQAIQTLARTRKPRPGASARCPTTAARSRPSSKSSPPSPSRPTCWR